MSLERYRSRGDHDPETIATQLGLGFVAHDRRQREEAVEAFAAVDRFQFQHVSDGVAREAAAAYVDALWAKDAVEDAHRTEDGLDREALDAADWTPVREAFARRASLVGVNPEYADLSTVAWRHHKTGGDYWTPMQEAQMYELRAALQDPDYPDKPRDGASGFGPEPARYALGVELHDTRRYEEGVEAMTPYFERIAAAHENPNEEHWTV
jgi:hypothetical protein